MLLSERKQILKDAIQKETGFSFEQLLPRNRTKGVAGARHIYCFFSKKYLRETLKTIGRELGGRDHTTVRVSQMVIKNFLSTNDPINDIVKKVEIAMTIEQKSEYTMNELFQIVGHKFKITNDEQRTY